MAENRSGCDGCFAGAAPVSFSSCLRNSSSVNKSTNFGTSGSTTFSASSSYSTGTSVFIVARNLENSICSLFSSTFFFIAPLSDSVLASRFSMLSYSVSSFTAVFSPTPGHPGMLSELSPMSPRRSITWSTRLSPHFSSTSFSPKVSKPPPNRGRNIYRRSPTSCP